MNKSFLASLLGLSLVVGCAHKPKVVTHPDGRTETEIKMADVPQKVTFQFNLDHPRITPKEVKKEVYADGTVHYEFEWLDADGKEVEAEYSATGEKLE